MGNGCQEWNYPTIDRLIAPKAKLVTFAKRPDTNAFPPINQASVQVFVIHTLLHQLLLPLHNLH